MPWTKRERIEAVFSGEQPDRVPIYDLMTNTAAVEYYSGEKYCHERGFEIVCKSVAGAFDMTRDIFAPHAPGAVYTTEFGQKIQGDGWTQWIVDWGYKDYDDMLRFIKNHIDFLEGWNATEKDIKEHNDRVAYVQSLIGDTANMYTAPNANLNCCYNLIGMEQFCYLMYDEQELVSRWLKAAALKDLRQLEAFADKRQQATCLIYCDIAAKGGLIFSYDFIKKELYWHLEEMCKLMHSKGIKVIFHSDGDIMGILDDLVNMGVDGLNPIEIAAGMDIKAIKERFGRKLVLCGGLDVTHMLPNSTPDQIRRNVMDYMKLAGGDYGLCIGSSTEIEDNVPLENVRAYIETVWEYGHYPFKF